MVETHVCILQTVRDLLADDKDTEVYVVCDAVSSQR